MPYTNLGPLRLCPHRNDQNHLIFQILGEIYQSMEIIRMCHAAWYSISWHVRKKVGRHFQFWFCWVPKLLDCIFLKTVRLKASWRVTDRNLINDIFKINCVHPKKNLPGIWTGAFHSLNTLMTDIRMSLEKVSLPCKLGQLLPVGCEVEQASQEKARYGALDLPRSLDGHAQLEGRWGVRACQESLSLRLD